MFYGLSTALAGMHRYSQQFDRAAQKVVQSSMDSPISNGERIPPLPPVSGESVSQPYIGNDLIEGMTEMMIAQRMFSASVRVAQASEEMMDTAVNMVSGP